MIAPRCGHFVVLGLTWLCMAVGSLFAQVVRVDWSQPAATLAILNTQILDWNQQFSGVARPPITENTLWEILSLHFQKGPIVVRGWKSLQDSWKNHASDSEKKSKYLAVSQYFATHTVDLGGSYAWEWYLCFAPPLSSRYDFLASESSLPPLATRPEETPLLSSLSFQQLNSLFQRTRPLVTDYLVSCPIQSA